MKSDSIFSTIMPFIIGIMFAFTLYSPETSFFTWGGIWQSVIVLVLCALAAIGLTSRRLALLGQWLVAKADIWPERSVPWIGFVWVLGVCSLLSGLLFHHVPHVNDTVNQYVHAKFLSQGHISGPGHPYADFFDAGWVHIDSERWYSMFPPGHIILLAIGQWCGVPWLVNPLLGACTVLAIHALAYELYGRRIAIVAVMLTCGCSWLLFLSSEYMNHATSLLCAALFFLYYARSIRMPCTRYAILTGLSFGMLFISRPFTAFALAMPCGAYALYKAVKLPGLYVKPLLLAGLATVPFIIFYGYWNYSTTGDALISAYQRVNASFWIWHRDDSITASLGNNLRLMFYRLARLNQMLFEWPLPSLGFMALLFAAGCARRLEYALLLPCLALLLAHMMFDMGWDIFGPRYLYEALPILVVLTALALVRLPQILRRLLHIHQPRHTVYGMTLIVIIGMYAVALPTTIAARAAMYGNHFHEGNYDYYRSILRRVQSPALVFLPTKKAYYRVGFVNPPLKDDNVIFALNRGEENSVLIEYYPCRNVYAMSGDTLHLLQSQWTYDCMK